MTLDPDAEYDRTKAKYPPFGLRDAIMLLALVAIVGVVSLYRRVDWFLIGGMATGLVAWEITKARLRRNAREFARASRDAR